MIREKTTISYFNEMYKITEQNLFSWPNAHLLQIMRMLIFITRFFVFIYIKLVYNLTVFIDCSQMIHLYRNVRLTLNKVYNKSNCYCPVGWVFELPAASVKSDQINSNLALIPDYIAMFLLWLKQQWCLLPAHINRMFSS